MAGAVDDLLAIMRDTMRVTPRDRLNAAVSASRVEKLQMPGEAPPESVRYLRSVIDEPKIATHLRREAAAALAFFERRSRKAAFTFVIADEDARRRQWRGIINSSIRLELSRQGQWPRKDVLLKTSDEFELPLGDPERTLAALLLPAGNRHARRRQRIDDPGGVQPIASEAERLALIQPIADLVAARLKACGM